MALSKSWLEVDREGMAQVMSRRELTFVLFELLQNAWDADGTTHVDVFIGRERGSTKLRVVDNSPAGWAKLSDAWTIFAPSEKKGDALKRGRFNLGEKLALAVAEHGHVQTMCGTVKFSVAGRRVDPSLKSSLGTEVKLSLKCSDEEHEAFFRAARTVLVPAGKRVALYRTTFGVNGRDELVAELAPRMPVGRVTVTLPTELDDGSGNIRPTQRQTEITIYEPQAGEVASIYEMGLPIVETGDRWHANILQKVPLNLDRDNVRPAYLRAVRVAVANHMAEQITQTEAAQTWAKEALEDPRITEEAATAIVRGQFGDKVVVHDPRDPESSKLAVAAGYTVLHGRQLSGAAWETVRRFALAAPATQVTPSNSMVQTSTDGVPPLDEKDWTPQQKKVVSYIVRVARHLGLTIHCNLYRAPGIKAAAWYGPGRLSLNLSHLGKMWFDTPNEEAIDELVIHELGHHFCNDHLDSRYHDMLCKLGAKMKGCKETLS